MPMMTMHRPRSPLRAGQSRSAALAFRQPQPHQGRGDVDSCRRRHRRDPQTHFGPRQSDGEPDETADTNERDEWRRSAPEPRPEREAPRDFKECGRHEDEHVCDHGSPEHRGEELAGSRWAGQIDQDRAVIRFNRDGEAKEPAALALRINRASDGRENVVAGREAQAAAACTSSRCSARPTRLMSRPSRRAFRAAGLNVQATGRSGTDRSVTARLETRNQPPRCQHSPAVARALQCQRAFSVGAARCARLCVWWP